VSRLPKFNPNPAQGSKFMLDCLYDTNVHILKALYMTVFDLRLYMETFHSPQDI